MIDQREGERLPSYPHGWAFLGGALTGSRQAFERAGNTPYWYSAFVVTAICAVLDSAGDPTAGLPMVVDIAAFTGAVLLLVLVATAVARRVCGGQGASAGATASQAALLYSTIDLPWEASGLVMGDDAPLTVVVGVLTLVVYFCYLTVLFSVAFEVGNGRAFAGAAVGHVLAFLLIVVGLIGCIAIVANAGAGS